MPTGRSRRSCRPARARAVAGDHRGSAARPGDPLLRGWPHQVTYGGNASTLSLSAGSVDSSPSESFRLATGWEWLAAGSEWMLAVMKPVSRWPMLATMNRAIRHHAPWLAAAGIVVALVFAPVAGADSSADPGPHASPSPSDPQGGPAQSGANPLVPNGTNSSGSDLPYNDAGNVYQHGGAV
jgi:hypothetical protein